MAVELIVPSVGESITEVEIGVWLKKPGDVVNQDDPVVVIETEKVTLELPAPTAGRITTMLKGKGEKASVGDVIGYMEPNGTGAGHDRTVSRREATQEPAPQQPAAQERIEPKPQESEQSVEQKVATRPTPATEPRRLAAGREEQVIPMTPIRRRIAERLVEAQKSAALLTTFNEIDMFAVVTLRKQ